MVERCQAPTIYGSFKAPECTYTSAILVVHGFFHDWRADEFRKVSNQQRFLIVLTVLLEVFFVTLSVGLQFSISGYLLREIPHLEPCKGICVNLQWMTVGVFTGEIIKDLAETGNMRKWIWQATYVKYLKCEGTPSQYDEMIWKQPEKSFGAFIILCKFLIALYLLFVGNRFILKSENNKDLVLNCVAMAFILQIDEIIHKVASSSIAKDLATRFS